ncbi:radical SAM protein [Micromonospora sp. NPDC007208]|uniref:radical SAM protein n=1 Tax=Micromonospora sp. NPDC007208 TaxID=3364236 RepID=UPI0036BD401C
MANLTISRAPDQDASLSEYVEAALGKCYVIPVAKVCNAACVFCATEVYNPKNEIEVMDESNLAPIASTLVSAGVTRFEVTGGGEPTLHPRLAGILASLQGTGAMIKLYSNGARLPVGTHVDELNISRCSIDPEQNQQLMRLRQGSEDIRVVVGRARDHGFRRIRLSVPIIRGGVETLPDALSFMDYCGDIVDAIVFRPLYPATPDKTNRDPLSGDTWLGLMPEFHKAGTTVEIEVDQEGCFRASQLILSSDLRLFKEWTLTVPAP